jgi:ketosteroid isomerase-like protein
VSEPPVDGVVEGYLEAVARGDWERLRSAVADDVVRIGPFGDVYTGRDDYVRFLSELMPTLPGYAMAVARVTYVDGGRRAVTELSETVAFDGTPTVTPEVLLVDLDADRRITRIEIFTRRA